MADRPGTPVDFARSYVYDPYDHIDEIKPNPDRTLYTLADKDDDITVYWAQKSFVDALRERGHDAVLIDQHGLGKFNHGLESQSFVTAALCAQKVPSRLIIEALEALARKQAAEAGK